MPNRILRDWTDSEAVNLLDWQAEVLFIRLVMKADDHGRFSANPKLLRSLCFPLRDGIRETDIARCLDDIQKAGLIRLYTAADKPLLQIEKFGQRVRSESKYDGPLPSNDGQMPAVVRLGGGGGGGVFEGGGGGGNGAAAPPPAGDAALPTEAEIIAFGEAAGIPPDYCRRFHSKTSEAHGWLTPHGRLVDWRKRLPRYWNEDRAGWGKGVARGGKSAVNVNAEDHKPW